MDIENYLKVVVEKITSNFNIERIILFGSYAYGQPTTDSDIDLIVLYGWLS
ncbi:MAG: Nucleotidyltransferase domain protein [Candidatus Scalindua rubra]|uniref:Nucleotidyltransferase domain protein n=1 Tax=Candidatus Scalindua rubra TaxID=1872076 RepID=A0A1E3X958_9BACT|nr:MAG: Nucleotidyltransferase domain protein [Candidatus Scalindua rubra]